MPFWKKGTYFWEASINDEIVGTKYFYIEESEGRDTHDENAYFQLKSLKLYEGQYDDVSVDDRVYYNVFSSEETRYVYAEIQLKNLNVNKNWQCELFVKFYNRARELKGQIVRLQRVKKGEEVIQLTAGWGSNVKGSWRAGDYSLELVFMDRLIATMPFEVDDEFVQGISPVHLSNLSMPIYLTEDIYLNKTFEEVMRELDGFDRPGRHQTTSS